MSTTSLLQILPGPFNFLSTDPEEVRRLLPDLPRALPMPRAIFLEDESATPIQGFPVFLSAGLLGLRAALRDLLEAEEAVQVAGLRREGHDVKAHTQSWDRYTTLLCRAVENATISSYGRGYPAVFWLQHSLDVARLLKDVPKRILRRDSEIGRRYGDAIKYRILDRFLDRVLSTMYDLMARLAVATEEGEEELFPRLLTRLRDNVLLFTEDYIGRDLAELSSYFAGSLRIDGRDLRRRLEELSRWHFEQLATDPGLRAALTHLLRAAPRNRGRAPQRRPPPPRPPRLPGLPVDPQDLRSGAAGAAGAGPGVGGPADQAQGVRADPRPAAADRPHRGARRRDVGPRAAAGADRPRQRRAAPLPRHPAARLHGALGARPAGRALRHDLRHQRLLGHPVAPPPGRQRQPGGPLPGHVPLPAPDQPPGGVPPRQAGEIPGGRRLLLQPRGHQPAALLDPAPALLRGVGARGAPLRPRHAHRPQLRPLPPDPHEQPAGGGGALRVLRPRP